jgi:hypothetical protein
MAQKVVRVNLSDVEFMLDLPLDTSIVSATSEGGQLVLTVNTGTEFPDNATLVYETSLNGTVSLAGAN